MEVLQHAGGGAPDEAPLPGHGVKMPRAGVGLARVALVVRGIHQEAQGDFEGVVHLFRIEREFKGRAHDGDQRKDPKARAGRVEIELAQRIHMAGVQADLLPGLA